MQYLIIIIFKVPATFSLAAQCLDQLRHCVSQHIVLHSAKWLAYKSKLVFILFTYILYVLNMSSKHLSLQVMLFV